MDTLKEEDDEAETHLNIITTDRDINDDGIVTYENFLNNELTNVFTHLQGRAVFTELGSVQHFCDIKINRPRTGYIYRYYNNIKPYIGCTTNIEKKEDNKTNTTYKFGRAVQEIGYDNFEFEISDKLKFNDWNDVYDVEDEYIEI